MIPFMILKLHELTFVCKTVDITLLTVLNSASHVYYINLHLYNSTVYNNNKVAITQEGKRR